MPFGAHAATGFAQPVANPRVAQATPGPTRNSPPRLTRAAVMRGLHAAATLHAFLAAVLMFCAWPITRKTRVQFPVAEVSHADAPDGLSGQHTRLRREVASIAGRPWIASALAKPSQKKRQVCGASNARRSLPCAWADVTVVCAPCSASSLTD